LIDTRATRHAGIGHGARRRRARNISGSPARSESIPTMPNLLHSSATAAAARRSSRRILLLRFSHHPSPSPTTGCVIIFVFNDTTVRDGTSPQPPSLLLLTSNEGSPTNRLRSCSSATNHDVLSSGSVGPPGRPRGRVSVERYLQYSRGNYRNRRRDGFYFSSGGTPRNEYLDPVYGWMVVIGGGHIDNTFERVICSRTNVVCKACGQNRNTTYTRRF